jgi:hypothetical protein
VIPDDIEQQIENNTTVQQHSATNILEPLTWRIFVNELNDDTPSQLILSQVSMQEAFLCMNTTFWQHPFIRICDNI